jgi:hypothetical protein
MAILSIRWLRRIGRRRLYLLATAFSATDEDLLLGKAVAISPISTLSW